MLLAPNPQTPNQPAPPSPPPMQRCGGRPSKLPAPSPYPSSSHSHRRDSDASLGSSLPSTTALLSDKSSQSSSLRSLNSYLSSLSAPFSLKPPYPSSRDITSAFILLFSRLHLHLDPALSDLNLSLKLLSCPIKIPPSALRAPGTPHSWPPIISVLHFLLQLARYSDHLHSDPSPSPSPDPLFAYTGKSYSLYIQGDDDAVAQLDEEYLQTAQRQAENSAYVVESLAQQAAELEAKVNQLRSKKSSKAELELETGLLEADVRKFETVVEQFKGRVGEMEGKLRCLGMALEEKERESRRLRGENEELRRTVEGQAVNVRDMEKMKRELGVVERDIAEAELGRNATEEKVWEVDGEVKRKLKEMEVMVGQCNQGIKKLKLGNDLQYVLNANGSSPAEVLGLDYKNILKPPLTALAEDTKKASVSRIEELISLQQQSRENATMLEEKRARLVALQSRVDEAAARLNSLKKKIEEYTFQCAREAEKVNEDFARKEQQLTMLEKDAEEFMKSSEQKLQTAIKESDEETQMCAGELLALIDSVTEYKELMESMTLGIKTDVMDLAKFVGEAYKASAVPTGSSLSLKRARPLQQSAE